MSYKLLNFFICLGLIGGTTGAFAQTRMLKLTPRQAVYYYAERGNVEQLLTLKQKYSLDLLDNQKNTALCEGIIRNNQTAIYSLLQAGANKDAKCVKKLVAQNTKASTAEKGLSTGAKTGIGAAIAALIGGVAVAAGGGGGGGGGSSNPDSGDTGSSNPDSGDNGSSNPDSGDEKPSIPVTSLPDGSTVPESGTSIQTVNNAERRQANYENAVASVDGTDSVVSVLATTTLTNNTSVEDVNNAYSNMNKILVNQDFTNATKEDILLSLAMAGEDIGGLKDKSLDEVKTAAQSSAIQSKAEDVYAKLGTERDLSLKDIKLHEPEFVMNGSDLTSVYEFIIDDKGNLVGARETDDGGTSVLDYKRIGDGKYEINTPLVNYGITYMIDRFPEGISDHITLSATATIDEIKEKFKFLANHSSNHSLTPEETNELIAWIDTLTMEDFKNTEDECENSGVSCASTEPIGDHFIMTYDSMGKNVGLKYSDFGKVTYDLTLNNTPYKEFALFFGGYEELSAKATDLPQVDTEMNFEGKALAQVWYENNTTGEEIENIYNGTTNLTFKDGKETLVADFTDWHKMTIKKDDPAYNNCEFTFEGTPTNQKFAIDPNTPVYGGAEITYYGENPKNPDEFVGSALFHNNTSERELDGEIVFGGVRK